jgi:hypothetical protein
MYTLRIGVRISSTAPWLSGSAGYCNRSRIALSGHNKWSTIKHDKARNDKAKSKERAMVGKEIASATQSMSLLRLCHMQISNFLY